MTFLIWLYLIFAAVCALVEFVLRMALGWSVSRSVFLAVIVFLIPVLVFIEHREPKE